LRSTLIAAPARCSRLRECVPMIHVIVLILLQLADAECAEGWTARH
jgi:hypothetical protein